MKYLLAIVVFFAWDLGIALSLDKTQCLDMAVLSWIVLITTPIAVLVIYLTSSDRDNRK